MYSRHAKSSAAGQRCIAQSYGPLLHGWPAEGGLVLQVAWSAAGPACQHRLAVQSILKAQLQLVVVFASVPGGVALALETCLAACWAVTSGHPDQPWSGNDSTVVGVRFAVGFAATLLKRGWCDA